MAGRRRNTIQIKLSVSMKLNSLIDDLSRALNLPKGIVLEEFLLDKSKFIKFDQSKIEFLKEKFSKKAP